MGPSLSQFQIVGAYNEGRTSGLGRTSGGTQYVFFVDAHVLVDLKFYGLRDVKKSNL